MRRFEGRPMRRLGFLSLLLLATPLFAIQPAAPKADAQKDVVQDVIRMAKAGVDDDAIIEFVEKSDGPFEVDADDLIAMTEAKVSKNVIRAVVNEADERNEEADKESADNDGGTRSYTRPVYVSPYYVPRYYDPYRYYDPFWYGPRLSIGFGFGYRGYYRPYFGGHGYRGHVGRRH